MNNKKGFPNGISITIVVSSSITLESKVKSNLNFKKAMSSLEFSIRANYQLSVNIKLLSEISFLVLFFQKCYLLHFRNVPEYEFKPKYKNQDILKGRDIDILL